MNARTNSLQQLYVLDARQTMRKVFLDPSENITAFCVSVRTLKRLHHRNRRIAGTVNMNSPLIDFTEVSTAIFMLYHLTLLLVRSVRMDKSLFSTCIKAQLSFFV